MSTNIREPNRTWHQKLGLLARFVDSAGMDGITRHDMWCGCKTFNSMDGRGQAAKAMMELADNGKVQIRRSPGGKVLGYVSMRYAPTHKEQPL